MVTIGDGYRDGSAGVVGLSAADRSAARLALESRHPASAHPSDAFQGLRSLRTRSQKSASPGPASDGCYRSATWTRLEPPWS